MVIAQIIMDQTVFSHLANTGSKMFVNALLNNLAFMFIQESLILKKDSQPVKPMSYVRKMSPLHSCLVERAKQSAADQSKDGCG